jgi:protein SCO1/2
MAKRPVTRSSTRRAGPSAEKGMAILLAGASGVLLLASLMLWLLTPERPPHGEASRIGGPFTLVADNGAVVTEHSFPGKYLLVYFGYTACRDVCPATLNTVAAALNRLGGKAALVQPLFITVDPLRDTPAVLRRYVSAFSPRLIGLTGSQAALLQAEYAYRVTAILNQGQGAAYALDHSAVLYLMAPDGSFVAPIQAGTSEMVMVQAISRYVS